MELSTLIFPSRKTATNQNVNQSIWICQAATCTGLKLISYCSTNPTSWRGWSLSLNFWWLDTRVAALAVQVFWTCQFAGHFGLSQKTKIATSRHLYHDDGILVHCIGARLLDITGARNYSIMQTKTASCENGPNMSKLIANLNTSHIFHLHNLQVHILLILNIGIRQKLRWEVCFPSPVAKWRLSLTYGTLFELACTTVPQYKNRILFSLRFQKFRVSNFYVFPSSPCVTVCGASAVCDWGPLESDNRRHVGQPPPPSVREIEGKNACSRKEQHHFTCEMSS